MKNWEQMKLPKDYVGDIRIVLNGWHKGDPVKIISVTPIRLGLDGSLNHADYRCVVSHMGKNHTYSLNKLLELTSVSAGNVDPNLLFRRRKTDGKN